MKLHRYVETDGLRIALVEDAGKLPVLGNGWEAAGEINISSENKNKPAWAHIIGRVREEGFFLGTLINA